MRTKHAVIHSRCYGMSLLRIYCIQYDASGGRECKINLYSLGSESMSAELLSRPDKDT